MSLNVTPTTDAGRAFLALAEEFLGSVKLPGMMAAARPFIEAKAGELVRAADANPDAMRASLRPLIVRLVRGLDMTAAELFGEDGGAA